MATPLTVTLSVNGNEPQPVSVADASEPLLYVLRNQFGLHGPKFGCGVAQCGACTVHVNGAIARSCVTRMSAAAQGARITTLEGLTGCDGQSCTATSDTQAKETSSATSLGRLLRQAFIDQQAAQCGYCANAMIMGAAGWLQSRMNSGNSSVPTEDEIKAFLSGRSPGSTRVYLCRCGTHLRIIRAIRQAAAGAL